MNDITVSKLSTMTKGWFVGDFDPTIYRTRDVEVGVKSYKAGDYDELHHHKVATEITVMIRGRARIGGIEIGAGDIVVIPTNKAVDFLVLEDCETVVVKLPGASNDKYLGDPRC